MKHVKKGKRKLGAGYSYKKHMGEKQIARLKKQPPHDFVEQRAASLTAGCVRIDAVLFRSPTGLAMAYDVFVKDTPDSNEWLCYDSLSIPVSLREADMLLVLARSCGKGKRPVLYRMLLSEAGGQDGQAEK